MAWLQCLSDTLAPVKAWVDGGSAVAAFAAAVFWFWASVIKQEMPRQGFELPPTGVSHGDIATLLVVIRKQSRLNAWAAGFAGVAAGLTGLSVLIGTRWG